MIFFENLTKEEEVDDSQCTIHHARQDSFRKEKRFFSNIASQYATLE